jgi:hypothetical protein
MTEAGKKLLEAMARPDDPNKHYEVVLVLGWGLTREEAFEVYEEQVTSGTLAMFRRETPDSVLMVRDRRDNP